MSSHRRCDDADDTEHSRCSLHNVVMENIQDKIETVVKGYERLADGHEKMYKLLTEIAILSDTAKRIYERQDKLETNISNRTGELWKEIDNIKATPWKVIGSLLATVVLIIAIWIGMYTKIAVLENTIQNHHKEGTGILK